MQVQVKFTASGCSAATGNFAPGDIARVSAEVANHFVNEAGCAVYVDKPEATKQTKPKRTKAEATQ